MAPVQDAAGQRLEETAPEVPEMGDGSEESSEEHHVMPTETGMTVGAFATWRAEDFADYEESEVPGEGDDDEESEPGVVRKMTTAKTKARNDYMDRRAKKEEWLLEIQLPEWVELVLAATGVSYLTFAIEKERERRDSQFFLNPFPITHAIVTSLRFEVSVAVAIVINCFLIGWEASLEESPPELEAFFSVCEHIFVVFFFAEWCMRILACGWVWVFEMLNFCDTVLVFGTGVLVKWIMEPLGSDVGFLRIFTVLRALRLARLAKGVRLIPFFKELWILIHGLTNSMRPLLWTFVMALCIVYVFAVAATELIGKRERFQGDEHVQERFGDLLRSMLTMFQLMTMDSWGEDVARPVMEKDNALAIFFVVFIGIGVFIFWNLITAIIVENAFAVASDDSAQKTKEIEVTKKRELRALADLFLEIDKDGSGELTSEEFFGALQNKKVVRMLDIMEVKVSDMEDVWNTLDDGDGLLTIKEFTTGMRRMKGAAQAKDIIDTVKKLRHTTMGQAELQAQVDQFGDRVASLETTVNRISNDSNEVVGLFAEVYHRLHVYIERLERQNKVAKRMREKAELNREMVEAEEAIAAEAALSEFPAGGGQEASEEDEEEEATQAEEAANHLQ